MIQDEENEYDEIFQEKYAPAIYVNQWRFRSIGKSFRKKMEEVWILKHLLACCTITCIHNFLHQNTGRIRSGRGIVGGNKRLVGNGKFRQAKFSK
jgi:hypothetical protein